MQWFMGGNCCIFHNLHAAEEPNQQYSKAFDHQRPDHYSRVRERRNKQATKCCCKLLQASEASALILYNKQRPSVVDDIKIGDYRSLGRKCVAKRWVQAAPSDIANCWQYFGLTPHNGLNYISCNLNIFFDMLVIFCILLYVFFYLSVNAWMGVCVCRCVGMCVHVGVC